MDGLYAILSFLGKWHTSDGLLSLQIGPCRPVPSLLRFGVTVSERLPSCFFVSVSKNVKLCWPKASAMRYPSNDSLLREGLSS